MKKFLSIPFAILFIFIAWIGLTTIKLAFNNSHVSLAPNPLPIIGTFDTHPIPVSDLMEFQAYISKVSGSAMLESRLMDASGKIPAPHVAQIGDTLEATLVKTAPGSFIEIVIPYVGKLFLDEDTEVSFGLAKTMTLGPNKEVWYPLDYALRTGRIWANLNRTTGSSPASYTKASTGASGFGTLVLSTKRSSFGLQRTDSAITAIIDNSTANAQFTKSYKPSFLFDGPLPFIAIDEPPGLPIYKTLYNKVLTAGKILSIDNSGSIHERDMTPNDITDSFLQRARQEVSWEDVDQVGP
ncbi:MAG: hypothetical protein WCK01_03340 [Candidatus Uhrbacteria bacterium]